MGNWSWKDSATSLALFCCNAHPNDKADFNLRTMKRLSTLLLFAAWFPLQTSCQPSFLVINDDAPTRLDLLDGSFAGPGFWGEALVGLTTNSLSHLGVPTEHRTGGTIQPEGIYVPYDGNPGVSQWGWVYVQLAAWDGRVWGTDFASVPTNQLGRTDTVVVGLNVPPGADYTPQFSQPAVVPPAPLRFATFTGSLSVSNGLFQLRAAGPSGSNVVVETSADLQAWTPIQTNALSSGVLDLSMPLGTNHCQFVRTRLAP